MINSNADSILYLNQREVKQACQEIDSVVVIRDMFRLHASGETILPDEAYLAWRNAHGEMVRSLNMPGYVGGDFCCAGTKIINGNPANSGRGLPRASGITLVYDDLSVRPLCIMEGAYISSLRTASVSALAIDLLQGPAIESLAIMGAGVLAQAHIELLVGRVPTLRTIRIFDLDETRTHRLIEKVNDLVTSHEIVIQVVPTPEAAIRPAQLVITATTTTTGYIPFAWLQPGALLINVSLDDFLPDVVLAADTVLVDDWNLVKSDSRRLLGRMYCAGQVVGPDEEVSTEAGHCRRIDAQLGDVVLGKRPGRRTSAEIILVNPFGLAIEDVALSTHVYRIARARGLGTLLER